MEKVLISNYETGECRRVENRTSSLDKFWDEVKRVKNKMVAPGEEFMIQDYASSFGELENNKRAFISYFMKKREYTR